MEKRTAKKAQVRRYLTAYHHLTDDTALKDLSEVPGLVRKLGCIQFDPLDMVGKNPDLVLQSRLPGYQREDIYQLLYKERKLFDGWDKNMSICSVEDWPFFSRNRRYWDSEYERLSHGIEVARAYLKEHEYASSSDIDLAEKVKWYWGNHRLSKAALEYMCYSGAAVVHHKQGTRRFYALAENCVPPSYLVMNDPNQSEADYCKWLVRRRINGIGILWNRGGDAWLGALNFKSAERNCGFEELIREDALAEISVEDIPYPLYLAKENLPLFDQALSMEPVTGQVRFMAPLDNMLWERKMTEAIFGFDYRWEVYTPADKRKYGYYVLPVLEGERFIGRIEMVTDRSQNTLVVKNYWWEDGIKEKPRLRRYVKTAIKCFSVYNRSEKIHFDCRL